MTHEEFAAWMAGVDDRELAERKQSLIGEIQLIEAQLADPNRLDIDGQRLPGDRYWSWRRSAIAAKSHLGIDLRAAKAELDRRHEMSEGSLLHRLERIEQKLDQLLERAAKTGGVVSGRC